MMILSIPGGTPQIWGSEVWLNVTGAVNEGNLPGYAVIFKVTAADGSILVNTSVTPDGAGNASLNIAPFVTASGDIKILWGYSHKNYITETSFLIRSTWFYDDVRTITIENGTNISIGLVTIPGGSVQISGNPVVINVKTTAAKMVGKKNYRIALKVTCDQLIGSPFPAEVIAPDKNLAAVFDISGLVDQPMNYQFDYPAKGACNPHDTLVFHITIDTGEVYIDDEGERHEVWDGDLTAYPMRIIKGKLRPYELALLNEVGKSFYSEYIQGGRFLTHLPIVQKVSPRHVPMLWYLSRWNNSHNFTAYLKINTLDKVAHLPMTKDFVLYDITGLVDFSFSPGFWGAEYDNVESYEFWLADENGDISEHRTYVVDNTYYERSFTFYYRNPLSGIDMIWLTGESSEVLKTESELAYKPVPFGSDSKVAGLTTIKSSGQRTWEINTGPKIREEILALRDFLEAGERWMVDPDNGNRLIPVVLEAGDFKLTDTQEDIPNFTIKIMEAH